MLALLICLVTCYPYPSGFISISMPTTTPTEDEEALRYISQSLAKILSLTPNVEFRRAMLQLASATNTVEFGRNVEVAVTKKFETMRMSRKKKCKTTVSDIAFESVASQNAGLVSTSQCEEPDDAFSQDEDLEGHVDRAKLIDTNQIGDMFSEDEDSCGGVGNSGVVRAAALTTVPLPPADDYFSQDEEDNGILSQHVVNVVAPRVHPADSDLEHFSQGNGDRKTPQYDDADVFSD